MKKLKKSVSIYDTTLRDGNQAIGIGLSLSDKLAIAEKLNELGFHYIEGGWPNSTSPVDREFFKQVKKKNLKSKIAVFGSTRRPGKTCSKDENIKMLIKSEASVATIYGKSWDMHVKKVISTSMQQNIDMITDTISYLKKYMDEVLFDAEHYFDGFLNNPDYALLTLRAAKDAGADILVLCDTNGGLLPDQAADVYEKTAEKIDAPLSVHMHNDSGCADANTFIAVDRGAIQVQGTVNGIGERCGNANLCTLIPGLQLKKGYRLLKQGSLKRLTEASIYISEIANISHNVRMPYVGEAAFSHKAGAHADGIRKEKRSFEHVDPESVGNYRRFVVSDQGGRSTIIERLKNIRPNIDKSDPLVKELLLEIKKKESEGYHFEAADGSFKLLVYSKLGLFKKPFSVIGFRVIEEKDERGATRSEATIKVEEKGVFEHTAAEGDGPVDAMDHAVRKALIKFFPQLEEVKLEDFKVRVLDGREGTGAKVRVLIESSDKKERWGTVGVSANIIEASWIALVDSLNYKLLKSKGKMK